MNKYDTWEGRRYMSRLARKRKLRALNRRTVFDGWYVR